MNKIEKIYCFFIMAALYMGSKERNRCKTPKGAA